jgi:lysylphosphatidylglycerol synthetase-like protein (DUF2156 family)/uncharacterized membrane protein YbhN (UPF0104 family)
MRFNFRKTVAIFKKLHLREILALLFILTGIYFFRQERHELRSIIPALKQSNQFWVLTGVFFTAIYILLQAGMYVFSFASIHSRITWGSAIELFLKRNFISIFLPAGGVTALAYIPAGLRKAAIHKKEVHQASGIYAFTGFLSLFIVGLPVIIYVFIQSNRFNNAVFGIIAIALLLAALVFVVYSIRKKGWIHNLLVKLFPGIEKKLQELTGFKLSRSPFIATNLSSLSIEITGMVHLYVAMLALGVHPSIEACCVGYIVSVVLLATSPFLRGLGAIELSLTYILTLYGYTTAQALEITILYRILEFWLPLAAGLLAFAAKGKNIFLRLAPAALIFFLGCINILSVITPPLRDRLHLLRRYIPMDTIHASNLLVLMMGLLLIVTAAFLIRGLRNAWIFALVISLLSCIGNLTKALDWEEASIAFFVSLVLLATRRQYRVKGIRPYSNRNPVEKDNVEKARELLSQYGSSTVDYFKVSDDKLIFLSKSNQGFIAYRVAHGFAIVLEEPVCAEENKISLLYEFDRQCRRMGLKPAFYRVDEDSMCYFNMVKKKRMLIGQEAVVNTSDFSLEGKDKKSLRNALNSLFKKGFTIHFQKAPLSRELVAELRSVSDEWLKTFDKKETIFSQGMFNSAIISQQDVIVMRNETGRLIAFLNIIPDYAPGECTYDMIRKTADAPGGCMDALVIELIRHAAAKHIQRLNLGMVPMSGVKKPENVPEHVVKYAYEKIKRFRHYQGLRDFKEKYATEWLNKYLVYENDFDLIQLPAALNKVMRPEIKST